MKRCPECGREFDLSMSFCLDDGAELLYGPASMDEPATAVYPEVPETDEAPTRTYENDGSTEASKPLAAVKGGRTRNLVLAGVAIVTLTAVAIGAYWYYGRFEPQISSIAVMPFVIESGNPDVDYLSDGVTETLIGSLSRIPNLNVKARASVFRYKGKDASAQTIGRELGVQAILNGRVVQRGEALTLYVELVDVQNENSLWKNTYNKQMADLVSLQSDVARDVAEKLRLRLTGADEKRVARNYTENSEAYDAYIKGRYFLNTATEHGYKKALESFSEAVARDPSYAPAYVGIADAYITAADWYISVNDSLPKAKAATLKALEMDDTLAEAHATLMWISWMYGNWADVEREYGRTIELDPRNIWARYGFAAYLIMLGRSSESEILAKQTLQIDPLSIEANRTLGDAYLSGRKYDQAIEQYKKTIEMDPYYWWPHLLLGQTYLYSGRSDEAIAEMQKARALERNPMILSNLAYAYAKSGNEQNARELLSELKTLSRTNYVSPEFIAMVHNGLGEREAAYEWLEKAFADRSIGLLFLKTSPTWDEFRSDKRFQDMMRRVGLPE